MKPLSPLHAAAVLALTLGSVQAVVLSPTSDTSGALTFSGLTVTKKLLTSAYGTSGSLPISKTRNPLIKFEVAGSEISSAAIREARLTLYFYSVTNAADINLHVITQSWDEKFIEASRTMPTIGAAFATIPASAVVKSKFVVVDVTLEVKAMMDSGNAFGFALTSPDGIVSAVIGSKEGTGTGYAPQLELVSRGILTPGNHNTGAGVLAMGSITTGEGNTAFGKESLVNVSGGYYNTGLGYSALRNNNGTANTATGMDALKESLAGNSNTANGYSALGAGIIGSHNTEIGTLALLNNNADGNTAVGRNAMQLNDTGNYNVAVGYEALKNNITGRYNVAIGAASGPSTYYLDNTSCLGYGAVATAHSMVRIGNAEVTLIQGQVAYTYTSDRTKKENFEPVDGKQVLSKIRDMELTSWNYIGHDEKKQRHYGPMAQDFYAAFGTDAVGTVGSPTTVNTGDMAGIMMSAIQELSKENAALNAKEAETAKQMLSLSDQIQQLRNQIGKGSD